ncbi:MULTISPECIES: hypothetical protein [unclassified Herbaspirillum]|uniref:hypothetical protein n=1 Tax=Bacteria TaxID=2 RepID=UPI000E39B191|nr:MULTISPECIES: hypothetical protein [unclassified Herbaspirillum]THA28602.1 hypothetical protein E6R62_39275 [Streptomyces sp. A1136]RFB67358.1 hypothetical protein DZB54_19485 [Herbaspirillum sp. 3R-3a1]TFI04966.1 hypothetical protein E4P32_22430 [Herbaspirillum sp. 3R11]TFI12704.1 hypothetical protein E4P31_21935 [Herbaspirillum sp. 3R-11]TFI20950.1 hypothetical protein E4P30_21405 [Herbaspirillum sp. 3C11]
MDKVAGTAAFRRFLGKELGRCARGGYADAVLARYRSLSAAAGLDEADAQEHAQLFNRLYTRWRWQTATMQVLRRRR